MAAGAAGRGTDDAAAAAAAADGSAKSAAAVIRNFRRCIGLPNVYRCADTDRLADRLGEQGERDVGERVLLHDAGLIVDLRSDSERDSDRAMRWTSLAPGGGFDVVAGGNSDFPAGGDGGQERNPGQIRRRRRTVLRLDPLSPSSFAEYLDENWLDGGLKVKAAMYKIVDGQKLHELRMDVLNERGLVGLYEAILETNTGRRDLFEALRAITVHMEREREELQQQLQRQREGAGGAAAAPGSAATATNAVRPVVIHCVQGKDRTGLLVMLCQSILGVPDGEIVECYSRSEEAFPSRSSPSTSSSSATVASAAADGGESGDGGNPGTGNEPAPKRGKLDRRVFSGAPPHVMLKTLEWIRSRYGSVLGYLDDIGFDRSWRERFVAGFDADIAESSLQQHEQQAVNRSFRSKL